MTHTPDEVDKYLLEDLYRDELYGRKDLMMNGSIHPIPDGLEPVIARRIFNEVLEDKQQMKDKSIEARQKIMNDVDNTLGDKQAHMEKTIRGIKDNEMYGDVPEAIGTNGDPEIDRAILRSIEKMLTPKEYRGYLKGIILRYRLEIGKKITTKEIMEDITMSNFYEGILQKAEAELDAARTARLLAEEGEDI